MVQLIIEFKNDQDREISMYLDDNDVLYFDYLDSGDTQHTEKILVSDLYKVLRENVDWKAQIKRAKENEEIKGWIERCKNSEKEKEKIENENRKLRGQVESLKEAIRIVK